ncbi:hypothetical protein CA85_04490 [Allorhodopirellula solitaria]|uniref:Uncharacterized protein n=1 Tax=Allorhodopirellula solitaria TaxID=2527987 RepID=A0A5C5YJU6_9BACT|nr:hypothetical protein CA85_04490 [Allorhodopirellula solitaria]
MHLAQRSLAEQLQLLSGRRPTHPLPLAPAHVKADGSPTHQRGKCSVLRGEQVIFADAAGYQDRFAVESRWHWP